MSLKLDELRKRLLQQPMDNGSLSVPSTESEQAGWTAGASEEPDEVILAKPDLKAVEPVKSAEPAAPKPAEISLPKERASLLKDPSVASLNPRPSLVGSKTESLAAHSNVVDSVAKLFEQTKTFQVRFDELTQAADVLDRLIDSAGRLFGPLRTFHDHLAQLSASFESMRTFQLQLAELGKTFEPMKIVHDQLAQACEAIQSNLAQLVKSLDPAKEFRDRIMALAQVLDQAGELQADFGELYSSFRAGQPEASSRADLRQSA